MNVTDKTLSLFTTRIRQMILQYQEIKKENAALTTLVGEREATIKQLEIQLNQAHNDYNNLKIARMLEISDGDMDGAQKRLTKLIKDVNRCITLLKE